MMFGTKKLIAGVAGGLAGGVVFGMVMASMGMLPSLMGHLMFGAVLGIVYHPLLRRLARVRPTAARVDREAEAAA